MKAKGNVMARRPIWHDEYWLLLIKIFLKQPQGVKRLYSKDLIYVAMELNLPPAFLHQKMMQLRRIDTPRLQRIWDSYANNPRKLARGIKLLRQMNGFGTAGAVYKDVREVDTWHNDFKPVVTTGPATPDEARLTPVMLIMILDLYFRLTPITMVPQTPEIIALAKLIHTTPEQIAAVMEVYRVCDPYIKGEEFIVSPLLSPCMAIWKRFGNEDPDKLAALAAQLKDYWE